MPRSIYTLHTYPRHATQCCQGFVGMLGLSHLGSALRCRGHRLRSRDLRLRGVLPSRATPPTRLCQRQQQSVSMTCQHDTRA